MREIEKFNRQLIIKCPSQAPLQMKDLKTDKEVKSLLSAIDTFLEKCSQESEQCKYWINYLKIISTTKNLVRPDNDRDFIVYENNKRAVANIVWM